AKDIRREGRPRPVPGARAPARGQVRRLLRRPRRLAGGESLYRRDARLHGARRGKPPRRLPHEHRDRGDPGQNPRGLRGLSRRRPRRGCLRGKHDDPHPRHLARPLPHLGQRVRDSRNGARPPRERGPLDHRRRGERRQGTLDRGRPGDPHPGPEGHRREDQPEDQARRRGPRFQRRRHGQRRGRRGRARPGRWRRGRGGRRARGPAPADGPGSHRGRRPLLLGLQVLRPARGRNGHRARALREHGGPQAGSRTEPHPGQARDRHPEPRGHSRREGGPGLHPIARRGGVPAGEDPGRHAHRRGARGAPRRPLSCGAEGDTRRNPLRRPRHRPQDPDRRLPPGEPHAAGGLPARGQPRLLYSRRRLLRLDALPEARPRRVRRLRPGRPRPVQHRRGGRRVRPGAGAARVEAV
ncbi:MAG: Cysteine desulfurase, partial [uncultured Rubrobacteraceae bacterium]